MDATTFRVESIAELEAQRPENQEKRRLEEENSLLFLALAAAIRKVEEVQHANRQLSIANESLEDHNESLLRDKRELERQNEDLRQRIDGSEPANTEVERSNDGLENDNTTAAEFMGRREELERLMADERETADADRTGCQLSF